MHLPLKKCAFLALLAGLISFGSPLAAQTKPNPEKPASAPTQETPAPAKKPSAGPFHGKLAALDIPAKTIKVGKRTFLITAATKIHKAGKPARLEDAVVGEPCSGYVKPDTSGRLVATTLNLGPKSQNPKPARKRASQP